MTKSMTDAANATRASLPLVNGAQVSGAQVSGAQVSGAQVQDAPAVDTRTAMRSLWQSALALQLPVAFWRQPRTTTASAIISLTPPCQQTPDFLSRTPGFYLAPFRESGAPLFLPADIRMTFSPEGAEVSIAAPEDGTGTDMEVAAKISAWRDAYSTALSKDAGGSASTWYAPEYASSPTPIAQEEYQRLVGDAINFIRERNIAKVVVSRPVNAALPADFDPVTLFDALCSRYAHAFVSLVAVPGIGTWIGASPELLLAIDNEALRTMALAGTQPRPDPSVDPATVRWGEKEIVEQELVSRYVRSFFVDAGYPNFVERGPQTVTAGKVFHLQTSFSIDLPEAERLDLANQVLSELHPTSAVCGMPRSEALSFIVEREGYDRSFYSGFLGPVFLDERSTLYVNLRCMQLFDRCATLYVGGGITAESDPEAEWQETVVKSQTILAVLGSAGEDAPAPVEPTQSAAPSARRRDEHHRAAPIAASPPARTALRHPASQTQLVATH